MAASGTVPPLPDGSQRLRGEGTCSSVPLVPGGRPAPASTPAPSAEAVSARLAAGTVSPRRKAGEGAGCGRLASQWTEGCVMDASHVISHCPTNVSTGTCSDTGHTHASSTHEWALRQILHLHVPQVTSAPEPRCGVQGPPQDTTTTVGSASIISWSH